MRPQRRIVLLAVCGMLVIAALAYAMTHPVLLRLSEGPLAADRRLVLFSPFRDREPETKAAQFINRLRTECMKAIAVFDWSPEKQRLICEREAAWPIGELRLVHRIDQPLGTMLHYVWYGPSGDVGSFVEIHIAGNRGNRRVVHYHRAY